MINKSLAVGIVFLFIVTIFTPVVISYDEPEERDEYLENLAFDSYHISETTNYDFKQKNTFDFKPTISSESLNKQVKKETTRTVITGPMDSPWPMYCHDVRHTGRSPYSTASNPGFEKWRFKCNEYVEGSAVIDNDGNIYFGSWEKFIALYPNGTIKWSYPLNSWIESSPSIDENGIIYVGVSFGYLGLYAFYPDGTLKWRYDTGRIYSSPAIGEDGAIYFGDYSEYITALHPNGSIKWRVKTNDVVLSSPAIGDDGTIYCGSHDTYLYALYPNNGTLKWKFKTGHWIRTSPSIGDDGTIYCVSLDNNLYAIYPNGTKKWETNVGAGTSPTIGQDGTIYCGYDKLHAVNPIDGSDKWTFDVSGNIRGGTPCNSIDGTIYLGTSDGEEIIAVNPDGSEKWRGWIGTCEFAPIISEDGSIYVGSSNTENVMQGGDVISVDFGYLHAFGPGDMKKIEIDFPEPGKIYLLGREIATTPRGNTFVIGDIDVNIKVYSEEDLLNVEYYIGPGRLWYFDFDLKDTDTESPFDWKIDEQYGERLLSCLMLRVVGYYKGGCEWNEDLEFWFFHF